MDPLIVVSTINFPGRLVAQILLRHVFLSVWLLSVPALAGYDKRVIWLVHIYNEVESDVYILKEAFCIVYGCGNWPFYIYYQCWGTWTCWRSSSSSTVISENVGRLAGFASQHLCIKSSNVGCVFWGSTGRSPWYWK